MKYHTLFFFENYDLSFSTVVIGALRVRPELFYLLIYGNCFSDLGSGGRKKINKKALKMTS